MDPLDLPPEESIDFRTSWVFPTPARLGGGVLVLFGSLALLDNAILGVIIFILGAFFITSHGRIKVDFGRRKYHEYTWVFGLKFGNSNHFEQLQYIFINKNKVTQNISAVVSSKSFSRYDFNAYLKFSERQKLHLSSNSSKKTLMHQMENIAAKLRCQLLDYTGD